jgi:enterochelin esterase-like enzyme
VSYSNPRWLPGPSPPPWCTITAIITGTRFSWIRLSSTSGMESRYFGLSPSCATMNGAGVPGLYCAGTYTFTARVVSGKYTDFIETEVLPIVAKTYNVTFTKDPEGRASMGGSSGAAAAFTMAWHHPERYRKVLSYSGTFVNQENPRNPEISRGAWEYHATLIPNAPPKPIRIWMHVGENDNGSTRDDTSLHNWVRANRLMAAALKTKGYQYRYVFAEGSGHTPADVINQTLPAALEWLWQGHRSK